jgi:type VI secretion system protein VasJ
MPELLEDISSPISDSAPSGEDMARLDSSPENQDWILKYAELRGLVRRVASNCDDIVRISRDILTDKSKDLRIASHLCLGSLHQKGFAGLAEALKAYHMLLEQYWDNGLHPQRESARASNITLLDKNLAEAIQAQRADKTFFVPTKPTDGDALEDIKETAEAIKVVLNEKNPDSGSSLDNLVRAVDARLKRPGIIRKQPKSEAPESGAETKDLPRRSGTASREQAAPAAKEEPAGAELSSDLDAIRAVIRAARFLFEKSSRSVVPYRLLRSILWYLFVPPNPDNKGNRIALVAVPPDKSGFEESLKNEDWESLITQCEAAFIQELERGGSSFSLDVQRFLSTALKELADKAEKGGDKAGKDAYEALNKVILQEVAMFVERFPFITEVLYSNKTPFADNQTKKWIEESVKPVFAAAGARSDDESSDDANVDDDSRIIDDLRKAEELLARQRWEEALSLMQTGINAEPTCKGRFQRRLNLANLCLDADQPGMARPLLEDLDGEIERFSLDQWEPGLCLQVWTGLKRCYQGLLSGSGQQESDGFYREKADRIFEKICRLDIRAALASERRTV